MKDLILNYIESNARNEEVAYKLTTNVDVALYVIAGWVHAGSVVSTQEYNIAVKIVHNCTKLLTLRDSKILTECFKRLSKHAATNKKFMKQYIDFKPTIYRAFIANIVKNNS